MPRRTNEPELMTPEPVRVSELHFDLKNPRLAEAGQLPTEAEVLRTLWREFSVDEVAMSIAHNGYWPHEPLLAAKEDGKLVVIEGNRRLAAVRLLRDQKLRVAVKATDLPDLSETKRADLDTLPVVICTREAVWQYLGFRHLNGPQNWRSFAKAQYIAQVHREFKVPLAAIAKKIGDQHSTVERLYYGFLVLTQAETTKVFDRSDCFKDHFSFSHLYTGLDYLGIQMFLGLPADRAIRRDPVPKDHVKDLGSLMLWLYGSKVREIEPLVKSQNPHLRQLDEALQSTNGITALRRGASLKVSLDTSRGDDRLFREAMQQAKESLQDARGKLLQGYDGEEDLLKTAKDVSELAAKVYEEMKEKNATGGRRRRRGGDR